MNNSGRVYAGNKTVINSACRRRGLHNAALTELIALKTLKASEDKINRVVLIARQITDGIFSSN